MHQPSNAFQEFAMSEHHSDKINEDKSNPVKLAVVVTIGAVGLVLGIIMLAYFAVGTHQVGEADAKANSTQAIAQRIAPATVLAIDPSKGSAAATGAVVPKSGSGPS
jgi:hypothetical protein